MTSNCYRISSIHSLMPFVIAPLLLVCLFHMSVVEGARCEYLCSVEHLKDKCDRCMSRIPMRFGKRTQLPPSSAEISPFATSGSFSEEIEDRPRNGYPTWEDGSSRYMGKRLSWDDNEEMRDFDWEQLDARDRKSMPEFFSPNPHWVCFRRESIDEVQIFRSNGPIGSNNDNNKRTATWL